MLLFFTFGKMDTDSIFFLERQKTLRPHSFLSLFGERKESPRPVKKRKRRPENLSVGSLDSPARPRALRPWIPRRMDCRKCTMMTPKGDAQSAETFRVVGMGATDRGRPRFCESNSGLRLARCPLSFLGRLKPFFSFWQRKKRMGSKKRSFGCGGRYAVATMYCNCSPTLIRLLRRHLPRRGRQSAAAGTGGQSRPPLQGAAENRRL